MAKDWEYAKLTKEAHAYGGPEEYLKIIKEVAYSNGAADKQSELQPLIIGLTVSAAVVGATIHWACQKGREKWKVYQEKKKNADECAEQAEKILIQKMHEAENEMSDNIDQK